MRKFGWATGLTAMLGIVALFAFRAPETTTFSNPMQGNPEPGIPDNVRQVLSTSCFDCHSAGSKNVKAKSKLNFSNWDDLSKAKKVSKLEKIQDVLKGGDMPPAKYIDKNPDKAPSAESKQAVLAWAQQESKKLAGE